MSSSVNKAQQKTNTFVKKTQSKLAQARKDLSDAAKEIKAETKQVIQDGKDFWNKNGTTLIIGTTVATLGIFLVSRIAK